MKGTFRLAWQGIRHGNFQHVLLSVELLIILVLLYICGSQLLSISEDTQYFTLFGESKIASCFIDNGEAKRFCEENGSFLGTIEGLRFDNNRFYLYTGDLFEAFYEKRPAGEGEYEIAALVTKELSQTYAVGNIYDITFVVREAFRNLETLQMEPAIYAEAKVYIGGVLDDVLYDGYYFTKDSNQMVGIAVNWDLADYKKDNWSSLYYYRLNDEETCREASDYGVDTLPETILRYKAMRQQQMFPMVLLAGVLLVLFLTGFLGQHILNLESSRRQFAVYRMCGADAGKALTIQLTQDISGLVLPGGLSLVLMKLLEMAAYRVAHQGGLSGGLTVLETLWPVLMGIRFNWPFYFICCFAIMAGCIAVSFVEILLIKRVYPVDVLREE